MKNLHIVAIFRFKENFMMEAIELLRKLVTETRKEEGCIQYELIEDIENKGMFYLIELWETQEHHHQHNGSEHLLEFRKNAAPFFLSSAEVYRGFKIF